MAESSSKNPMQFYEIDLPNKFGECTGETIVLLKKYYRLKVSEDQFDRLFGNHEFIVSSIYDDKETHSFDNRLMASVCAQRLSLGGIAIVTIRDMNFKDGNNPLTLLCVYFNGRIVTFNRVNHYIFNGDGTDSED